jgi:2-dehydropantoate 2-reductase
LAAEMMREAQSIGDSLGVRFRISIDKRIAGAAAVGEHKTSMLQDVEAGRALELAALMGTVLELGQITGIATPHISAIHACSHLLDTILTQKASRLSLTKL